MTDQLTVDANAGRVAGSFRDPAGYVFLDQDRVYRAISAEFLETYRNVAAGPLPRLIASGAMIGTTEVNGATAASLAWQHPNAAAFLEHTPIHPITYPYEWTVTMLGDAARRTLEVQMDLLSHGFGLKDASAYNVQFQNGRAVLIDVASIDTPARPDVWIALGQFGQMFTYPLLLCVHHGWDLQSYFLSRLNGRSAAEVADAVGWSRWHPRTWLDVTLPAWLGRRNAGHRRSAPTPTPTAPRRDASAALLNLRRLDIKIRRLAARYRPSGVWANYHACSYAAEADQAKKEMVESLLQRVQPRTVLDLGCNTGEYSFLAARCGSHVLAVDADHDAVDCLYRRLREEPAAITPMVADITNPSPAIGFRNTERAAFLERATTDCLLALAVIHHLHVSGNLSLAAIRDQFHALARRHVIVEFVPREDPMFVEMTRFRESRYDTYTFDTFRRVFASHFEFEEDLAIPGSARRLVLLRRLA